MGAVPDTMFTSDTKPAWHGIGKVVGHLLNAKDALTESGLLWTVSKQPIYTADMVEIPKFYASTRDDNGSVLGIVGERYRHFQNVEGFSFIDSIIGDGGAKFATAGSLYGGATVWILAELPDEITVAGDAIKPYFLLKNTHDGSSARQVLLTPTRVVCQNTLNMALKEARRVFSVPHTRDYDESDAEQVKAARSVLKLTRAYYESFATFCENLLVEKFTQAAYEDLCKALIPIKENGGRGRTVALAEHEKLVEAWNARDLDNVRGTKFAAYNAIADYSDHMRRLVGTDEVKRDNAFSRTFEGTDLKDKALALLTA